MRVQKNLIRELNEWMDNILYGLMHTPGGNLIILVGGAITLALALYNW